MSLKIAQNVDIYLEKKSEIYFLLKRISDYEGRMHHHGDWSIEILIKYEKKWRYLSRKYNRINIYGIEFVGIGETIPRLFMYLRDRKKRDRKEFHIVLPTFDPEYTAGVVNNKIFDVFGKYVHFITVENIDFWKYVFIMHSNKIYMGCFDVYKYRDVSMTFNIKVGKPLIPFSDELKKYAKEKMREMDVRGEYICLHAREVATKMNNFKYTYADTSVVDADINSFGQACIYMQKLGFQAIRIGKDESKICKIDGVIDYANDFYDELMDFYLLANCKFLIGCMSGITSIAAFWGRPILQTNALSFCYGQESLPRTSYDLYIPKKFYSKCKNKFLNLFEMLDITFKCDRYNELLEREGVSLIDNTDEEILNATIEMNEKLDHTWIQTEEEIRCMEKYWHIVNLWKSGHALTYKSRNEGGNGREMFPRPICYSYLKENLYLLDVKELYEKS